MPAVAASIAAAVALIVTYVLLGGASYAPAKAVDPCAKHDRRTELRFQAVAEHIVLSAFDGVACELGVSREELVLAFASRESLERFAREQRIANDRLERLVRSGLVRAVDDAERADVLSPATADLVRTIVREVPLPRVLDVLELLPGA
jgi:hypothetical protein